VPMPRPEPVHPCPTCGRPVSHVGLRPVARGKYAERWRTLEPCGHFFKEIVMDDAGNVVIEPPDVLPPCGPVGLPSEEPSVSNGH
jgi:hypothetical protein